MNCDAIREQLLRCEDPARPPAGLNRHLNQCAACQGYRQRLLEVEDTVRGLSVPTSTRRDRLVARLQEGELPTPPAGPRPSAWRPTLKERAQQKLALALALAASLALFALGWAFWPHGTPSISAKRAERNQLVERASSPRDRVQAMSAFVRRLEIDVVHAPARTPAEQLENLSAFYIELVEEELPRLVEALSPADRAVVLPVVLEQLRRGESDLGRACADRTDPPENWRRMVQAARTGQVRLQALYG